MQVRKLIIVLLVLAVVGTVYGFVVSLYSSSLATKPPTPDPPSEGVAIVFTPNEVQPVSGQISGIVMLYPGAYMSDNANALLHPIEVDISPAIVGARITYPQGLEPTAQQVVLPISGDVQNYPLDTYLLASFALAYKVTDRGVRQQLMTQDSVYLSIAGWSGQDQTPTPVQAVTGTQNANVGDLYGDDQFVMNIQRSPSTKMLAAVLLVMLISLGTVAGLMAIWVYRGRIKADFAPAGWMTAMLFAVLPVRGFFPGSPPIGAWMDILIVFWVILIIMLSVTAVATILLSGARKTARANTLVDDDLAAGR